MIYWNKYEGHLPKIMGKRNKVDNNIYTFDIETTSYLILNNKQLPTNEYLKLTKKEQEECEFRSTMYIWQFGINNKVYYGRTYEELFQFMNRIEYYCTDKKKIVFVHNLSWEFQFLRNIFHFKNVVARKSHKVMKCEIEEFNFEFRCSLYMTNLALEKLPKVYGLDVEKKTGDLDYFKIRHSNTELTEEELKYCENDCLVVYKYILKELEKYETVKNIPLTSTGHVRRELRDKIMLDFKYKYKTKKAINTDGHIYNLMLQAFAGGYTHANWIYTDEIIKNVTSYDFTSSYPYCMVAFDNFPMSKFKKCYVKSEKDLWDNLCYILVVRFKNIKCKYYNNFISLNKCRNLKGSRVDNGRIISADELEITLTEIDFKFFLKAYECEYEIIESYYARKGYLPKQYIEFTLEKYIKKTQYKNVDGKEIEYNLEKQLFNSLYGMSVTNNIKDIVIFDNITGWEEIPLSNDEILNELEKEEKKGFLSFSWGIYVTSIARNNLLENVLKLDEYTIYCDTDSCKLKEGYNKKVIEDYNKEVMKRLQKASKDLEIDINKFMPKDIKGKKHPLGLFENETIEGKNFTYDEFITQGAKKYAVKINDEIKITVAGVPKKRC